MRGHSHQTIYRPAMRLSWGKSRNSRRFPRFRGQRVSPWQHFLKWWIEINLGMDGYLFLLPGSSELRVFSLGTFYVQVHVHVCVCGSLSAGISPVYFFHSSSPADGASCSFCCQPPQLFLVHLAQAPHFRLLPFHLWSLLRLTTSQWLWFSPFLFLFFETSN